MSATLPLSYGTGYAIGTYVVAPLIQTYAPDLWTSIGNGIGSIVDALTNSWDNGTAAAVQATTAVDFGSTGLQINSFSTFGGDYGAANAWASGSRGGGGCPRGIYNCTIKTY